MSPSTHHPTMKSTRPGTSRHPVNEAGVVDHENGKSSGKLMLGDVVWIQLRNLWLPAQVTDEKMVSKDCRPAKKSKSEVLLRVYGTYNYLYRDPRKYSCEFEKVLHQNGGSHSEIFRKALEQDLSYLKSKKAKRGISEERDSDGVSNQQKIEKKIKVDGSGCATPKQESPLRRHKTDSLGSVKHPLEQSSELSARRIKVMQSLGLVAPQGSPFRRNGVIASNI